MAQLVQFILLVVHCSTLQNLHWFLMCPTLPQLWQCAAWKEHWADVCSFPHHWFTIYDNDSSSHYIPLRIMLMQTSDYSSDIPVAIAIAEIESRVLALIIPGLRTLGLLLSSRP